MGDEFIRYLPVESHWGWTDAIRMGPLLIHQKAPEKNNRHKDSERIIPDYECPGSEAMDKAYELILDR